jgi:hypothetical protein
MVKQEFEERLDVLEKKVEDLTTELHEVKREREEEATLIPGAEYDFVPSVQDRVIARGIGRIVRVIPASNELGLSAREWEQFSADEDDHD